jgi:hypothetical protein
VRGGIGSEPVMHGRRGLLRARAVRPSRFTRHRGPTGALVLGLLAGGELVLLGAPAHATGCTTQTTDPVTAATLVSTFNSASTCTTIQLADPSGSITLGGTRLLVPVVRR